MLLNIGKLNMIRLNSEHFSKTVLENLSLEELRSKISSDGFFILKDLIPHETIKNLKIFWTKEFKEQLKNKPDRRE